MNKGLLFILAVLYSASSYAIYKCENSNDQVSYQANPCKVNEAKELDTDHLMQSGTSHLIKRTFNIPGRKNGIAHQIELRYPQHWENIYDMPDNKRQRIGYTGFSNTSSSHKNKRPIFYAKTEKSETKITLWLEPDLFYVKGADGYMAEKNRNIKSNESVNSYLKQYERVYKYKRKSQYKDVSTQGVFMKNGMGKVLYAKFYKGRYPYIVHAAISFDDGLLVKINLRSTDNINNDYKGIIRIIKNNLKKISKNLPERIN